MGIVKVASVTKGSYTQLSGKNGRSGKKEEAFSGGEKDEWVAV